MRIKIDRNRLYLLLVYFSMSFLYLAIILGDEDDPLPLIGYILALIMMIVLSHDTLLRVISFATGQGGSRSEFGYFSAFIDLNKKIHNFLQVNDVLLLVTDTLREKVQVRKMVCLLSKEIPAKSDDRGKTSSDDGLTLLSWPEENQYGFHTAEYEKEVLRTKGVFSIHDCSDVLHKAFEETSTSLAIPIIQDNKILCIILIGKLDNKKPYTEFELQMFGFLANQLSIILDRIRVYEKVMQKTVMDHAEKMQVMQSLSANIAHEMRTPLSGIRASISGMETYLPQLLECYEYCITHEAEKFLPIRESHVTSLQGTPRRIQLMIDQANTVIDMLLMNLRDNSLDRRQLNICSAASIVEQAVDRYPFKKGERDKLYLELDKDFQFLGIESLLIYVLFNLLKNAYYSIHSATNGEITISLVHGMQNNYLYFKDTGQGIDPEIMDKIFDGFFTTKSDGTGAGLAFCKRTMLSFGGDIECVSEAGAFAEFKISLPVFDSVS